MLQLNNLNFLRFGHFAVLDAAGADAHTLGIPLAVGHADRLKIGKETALGDAGSVQTDAALVLGRTLADNDIAGRRTFTADFTNSGHDSIPFV